jgi:hypothetical protein
MNVMKAAVVPEGVGHVAALDADVEGGELVAEEVAVRPWSVRRTVGAVLV